MVAPEWPFSIDPLLSMLSTPTWYLSFSSHCFSRPTKEGH